MNLSRRRAISLLAAMFGGAACGPRQPVAQPGATITQAATPTAIATAEPAATEPRTATPMKAMTATPTTETTSAATPTTGTESAATPSTGTESAATATPAPGPNAVMPGVDVLLTQRKDLLEKQRLGLVTNATGRTRDGRSTIDALQAESSWRLVALFSPEHGIRGEAEAGEGVDSAVDRQTGLPIYSLYGETTRPTGAMLRGLDVLVYDIQDVGARPYTYISTLLEVMRAAAEHGMPVVVLDRPDPIGGDQAEGNVLDPSFESFVGPAPIAMRYGLTIGELGRFFNAELQVNASFTVVPMSGWQRKMWFDETGLQWVNPSPNIRNQAAAGLYPGTVLFEGTTLSEGRGTDRPFEWIGAPWMDARAWADALNTAALPGVRFATADKTPATSKFANQLCHGVLATITDRSMLRPMEVAIHMLEAARKVGGTSMQLTASNFDLLAGTDRIRKALDAGTPAAEIVESWQADLARFRKTRDQYLLY